MTVAISVLLLVVILGLMITIHELGHFLAARLCRIRVREFAIGMGPAVYKRESRVTDAEGNPLGTRFSLRAFPIGGFCDMSEDEESPDADHFRNKPLHKRIIVLAAGSVMNLLLGFIIVCILNGNAIGNYIRTSVITELLPEFSYTDQMKAGDKIIRVNGESVHSYMELAFFLDRDPNGPYDFVLLRDGKRVEANGIERKVDDGDGGKIIGFVPNDYEYVNFWTYLRVSWENTWFFVRLVRISIVDIFTGRESVGQMMGPVGMGSAVNEMIQPEDEEGESVPFSERVRRVLYFAAIIAVNLAVFNMLPIPALDGGRILLAMFSALLLLIRKRPLSAKIEGALHGGMFALLILLMIVVFFNDIRRIITGG